MSEVAIQKHVVVMKSGVVHFVQADTAKKLEAILVNQEAHSFNHIRELAITINSAEIEGVYTPEKYEEYLRIKAGEFLCAYGTWHKRRDVCDCKNDFYRREQQRRDKEARDKQLEPPTPEQRSRLDDAIRLGNEIAVLNGSEVFRASFIKKGKKVRRSTVLRWEKDNGRKPDLSGLLIEKDV